MHCTIPDSLLRPVDTWTWDPSYYYAQLRSPIIDHDLNLDGEVDPPKVMRSRAIPKQQYSLWPVGPSIAWSPFFLLAHGIYTLTDSAQANGYALLYIALVSAGSAAYGLLGVLITYRLARLFGDSFLAMVTSLLCLFASPLVFYIYRHPIVAHAAAFLVLSLLVYVVVAIVRGSIPLNRVAWWLGFWWD